MFNNKRGLSPLIASVLLIAFTVTLFIIISSWTQKSLVEPGLQQSGEKIAKTLDCLSAKVKIASACRDAGNTKVKISVDNDGDVNLEDLKVRVVGATSVQSFNAGIKLAPLERYNSGDKTVDVGAIQSIEVYPVTISGSCTSNPTIKSNLPICA